MNGISDNGDCRGHKRITGLSKRYAGDVQALDLVDLEVAPGVFGLLGPNGAGKSTLMRIIATLQDTDSGRVRLGEIDAVAEPRAMRQVLGYLSQDVGLPPSVTAERLLDHLAELKGLVHYRDRSLAVRKLLERTNLWKFRRRKVGTFSGGMRQRFGIAQALLAQPRSIAPAVWQRPGRGLL